MLHAPVVQRDILNLVAQLHLGHEDIIPPRMMNLGYMLSSSLIGTKFLGIKSFQDATHGILCDSVLLDD